MTPDTGPFEDFIITINPDTTPEVEERFLDSLASAILAIARHLVDKEMGDGEEGENSVEAIEF